MCVYIYIYISVLCRCQTQRNGFSLMKVCCCWHKHRRNRDGYPIAPRTCPPWYQPICLTNRVSKLCTRGVSEWRIQGAQRLQLPLNASSTEVKSFYSGNGLIGELPSESKRLQAGNNYFRIIFGGSTGKSCNSPGGCYRGVLLQDRGPYRRLFFWEFFPGALQENPVIAPGQLHEKIFTELFW